MKFCELAMDDSENDYFFIIDEINRGNLSKIFGELMFLIEKDKRGIEEQVEITYQNPDSRYEKLFFIPKNVFIIGTMNTADRSLAMVDYALRRRFVFKDLNPMFQSEKFKKFLTNKKVNKDLIDKIITNLTSLNDKIEKDEKNLGKGYRIGHSYFCPDEETKNPNEDWYRRIIEFEIKPLLREYWFDDLKELIDEQRNCKRSFMGIPMKIYIIYYHTLGINLKRLNLKRFLKLTIKML